MTSYYTDSELNQLGFKSLGNHVKISRNACFYGLSNIVIGNNVRIDDFCVISAGLEGIFIGNYVHIGVFCSLQGDGKITLNDFSGISSRVSLYSSNEDYFGNYLTNPTIPNKYRKLTVKDIYIDKHVIIGSGSVILPGVNLEIGVAVGAMSLVDENCDSFFIYKGNPLRKMVKRKKNILLLEKKITNNLNNLDD